MEDVHNRRIKKEILQLVEKNPQVLESLSIDKLEEINKMYNEFIEENEKKLKRIRKRTV